MKGDFSGVWQQDAKHVLCPWVQVRLQRLPKRAWSANALISSQRKKTWTLWTVDDCNSKRHLQLDTIKYLVQNYVLSTLHQKILSPNQLTQMQQEPMSAMKGLQNNWSKGKMTKMTEKNHVSRLFRPSCWSDSKLHKKPIVDSYKSHDWCFITKALNLPGGLENDRTSWTLITFFWLSRAS